VRRLAPDGLAAWQQVVERGFEGYVAKDELSVALPPRACSAASVWFMSSSKVGMRTVRFV
jgi:hypothetical protein